MNGAGKVLPAYVHSTRQVEHSFHLSQFGLASYDAAHHQRLFASPGPLMMRHGTGGLIEARNKIMQYFLDDASEEWLFMVDTDMGFAPDTVDRLVDAADPTDRPVMGALCFGLQLGDPDGYGGFFTRPFPTIYVYAQDPKGIYGFHAVTDYPRDQVVQVAGTGTGCLLIHRSAAEKVRAEHGDEWFTPVRYENGRVVSEDLSFCYRLGALGIPVHVDTRVKTTHAKQIWVGEREHTMHLTMQQALAALASQAEPIPREQWAAHRFAVIPTHNRPEHLKALVAALGPQVDGIVVLDNASDPPTDWVQLAPLARPATVEVLRDPQQPPNLSQLWNVLFDRCAELAAGRGLDVWDVAVLNDDAVVPGGWFDVCSAALRSHDKAAVAHTGTTRPVDAVELVDAYPYPREKRMCPWAFVVRGEAGLRCDESMRWWFFDDDFNRQAIDAGGVLAVPGPLVVNAEAVQSTVGVLAEQTRIDQATFEAKWGALP